jgi:hypothetical protein
MWRKFKDTPRDKWKAADGQQSFRVDTDGQGHERPALYRYVKEIELTSPSKWGRAAAGRRGSSTGYRHRQSAVPDVYREPYDFEDSQNWDRFVGTADEHEFAVRWLYHLQLIPDEMHITQRLIEGWRDAVEACVVYNGSRQQGSWAFRALWAAIARKDVFIRNWRTHHLRVALAVAVTQSKVRTMTPAVLVVVGESLACLVHYMKHDPDIGGAPPTAEVPSGKLAAVYSQISACVLAVSVWLLCTRCFPKDMGRRLHLHALWELVRLLSRHPWLLSRSCEWGEHAFYKEATARHVARTQVLGVLALHRWERSRMWATSRPTRKGSKQGYINRALNSARRPLPFPVVSDAVVQFGGGQLWSQFKGLVQPLLEHHSLEWIRHESPAGHHVWMPVQTGMDKTGATARTLQNTARACMEAIGEGLQAETVKVGAPHSTGRHDGQVPAVVLNGGQGGDRTAALCAMVGCATQAQWRQRPVDCTEFGKVYPPDALQEKAGRTVQPALAEDVVDREFTLFAEGTTLQKDEHGLAEMAAHLGVKVQPGMKAQVALERHFGGARGNEA